MSVSTLEQEWIPHSRPDISAEDFIAVQKCLASGMITYGTETAAFAKELARRYGYRHAMCCGSGSEALIWILSALGIGVGAEVILPTYVCHSVADAVLGVGASPRFCDVNAYGLMDSIGVRAQLTSRSRAIIAVHIFGMQCDIEPLKAFGLPVIEDFAQMLGHKGKIASDSTASFFSFHPTKCLTAGMGGMLACDDTELFSHMQAAALSSVRHVPLPNMNAALGRSQLARYDSMLQRREEIAAQYLMEIPAPWTEFLRKSPRPGMFYRFCIRKNGVPFERVQRRFADARIHVRRGVDELLHIRFQTGQQLPGAETLFAENVSLPIYPSLSAADVQRVLRVCEMQ